MITGISAYLRNHHAGTEILPVSRKIWPINKDAMMMKMVAMIMNIVGDLAPSQGLKETVS